jgi:hypothetical protein
MRTDAHQWMQSQEDEGRREIWELNLFTNLFTSD